MLHPRAQAKSTLLHACSHGKKLRKLRTHLLLCKCCSLAQSQAPSAHTQAWGPRASTHSQPQPVRPARACAALAFVGGTLGVY